MTDKKDVPPKGPERRGADAGGTGTKRPFATLDLQATEVSSPATGQGKEQPNVTAPAPAPNGTPTEAAARESTGDFRAAAARIAAAAADLPRGSHKAAADVSSAPPGGTSTRQSASAGRDGGSAGPGGLRTYATHVGAGVLGGVVAVLGSLLLGTPPGTAPPAAGGSELREVQQKLAALQKSISERPPTPAAETAQRLSAVEAGLAQLDGINRAVATLQEAQGKLSEQTNALQASLQGPYDRDAADRLGKLEAQLGELSSAAKADPQTAARIGTAAQITTRMGELESAVGTRIDALRQELETRVEREVAGAKSDAARVSQRVDALRAGTERMEQALRALQSDAGALSAALEKLRADNEARLASTAKAADIASAVAPVTARIAALEGGLQAVERAEEARKTNADLLLLSLELANLKRAMDRGGSYAAELAAVRKMGGARIDLGALERYQHDGVATTPDLAREFRGVANAMLDADAEQPDASLVDRLLSGARTIVRVRKVAHAPDDASTEAIVARIEAAVRESRLADALAEAKKLPPRAAVAGEAWLEKLEARQSVDATLARLEGELKASLTGAAPGQKGGAQ